jgi:glycosyltransferase involved in cell wall biosynthesis
MKIAFISTRGIPNHYGGFEQFAESVSVRLAQRGHDVTVYSPHYHPFQEKVYQGVKLKHVYSPEGWMGSSVGSFFYDYQCLKDALKRENFDIIYDAGYTSIVPAYMRFDVRKMTRPVIMTNMDGLEYKRAKYNWWVQRFLLWEERMAVKYSHYLIADNMGIRDYFLEKYGKESRYVAYGADIPEGYHEDCLQEYGLTKDGYLLIIARMEPEYNIEMAIKGYRASEQYGKRPLVIVGRLTTTFGKRLAARYGDDEHVRFVNGIYDTDKLNAIRHFAYAYFHGHSVGGTNPSLLEAMATECFILSHDNVFNRVVLGDHAVYFQTEEEVKTILNGLDETVGLYKEDYTRENLEKVRKQYSWDKVVDDYEGFFAELMKRPSA